MRRGCMRHSCALWEALGYGFVVGLGWESIQVCAAHAVTYTDDGPRHFFALDVDKVKEVSGVVEPAGYMHLVSIVPAGDEKRSHTVVAQEVFVYYTALALVRDIRHPYASNAEAICF